MDEVTRVLAPFGVACVKSGGKRTKTVKPWPKAINLRRSTGGISSGRKRAFFKFCAEITGALKP